MGYTEGFCQLCGISFNIARIRRPEEPESDAWDCYTRPGSFVTVEWGECAECPNGLCQDVLREGATEKEHLAGPNCRQEYKGYSGSRIGADEMRERTWIQCLCMKDDQWVPEPGDEDFEIQAKHCFATGISKEGADMVSTTGFEPVKHGIENSLFNSFEVDTDEPWGLPMHPSCFVMFERMSIQRFGAVDIDGLWLLRRTKGDNMNPRFPGFDERKDVTIVREQWYRHVRGTEYLAANPVDVPDLTSLIESHTDISSSVVFNPPVGAATAGRHDPFDALPPELCAMLLEMLKPRDVANLRQSSRAFLQLPQACFKHLIRREMPWVWELREGDSEPTQGIDWFALWNKLSASDGGSCADEKERAAGDVDESHLYDGRFEIKGLRNRRMIYRDITIILDMISNARADFD